MTDGLNALILDYKSKIILKDIEVTLNLFT
jgi:hypothetical protein